VREDGCTVGGAVTGKSVYRRGMEEAPDNGKESSHSTHADGMNELLIDSMCMYIFPYCYQFKGSK
jgi:hypothetical protein